jgi:hypothetical protein
MIGPGGKGAEGPVRRRPMGRSFMRFLQSPPVQKELGLDSEQTERLINVVADVTKQFAAEGRSLEELHPSEARERGQALAKQLFEGLLDQLRAFLQPEQVRRVEQIELQLRGPMAFADTAVTDALGLTAEQRSRLLAVREQMRAEIQGIFFSSQDRGGHSPEFRQKVTAVRENYMKEIIALLTDVQSEIWAEMTGVPFVRRMELGPEGSRAEAGRPILGQQRTPGMPSADDLDEGF